MSELVILTIHNNLEIKYTFFLLGVAYQMYVGVVCGDASMYVGGDPIVGHRAWNRGL